MMTMSDIDRAIPEGNRTRLDNPTPENRGSAREISPGPGCDAVGESVVTRTRLPSQRIVAAGMAEVVPLTEDPRRPGCVAGVGICTGAVVGVLTAGCLHEHLRRGRVCAHHLNIALDCRACRDNASRPHKRCTLQRLHVEGDFCG